MDAALGGEGRSSFLSPLEVLHPLTQISSIGVREMWSWIHALNVDTNEIMTRQCMIEWEKSPYEVC